MVIIITLNENQWLRYIHIYKIVKKNWSICNVFVNAIRSILYYCISIIFRFLFALSLLLWDWLFLYAESYYPIYIYTYNKMICYQKYILYNIKNKSILFFMWKCKKYIFLHVMLDRFGSFFVNFFSLPILYIEKW